MFGCQDVMVLPQIGWIQSLEPCGTLKLRQTSGPVPAAASPLFNIQQVEEAVQLQVAFKLTQALTLVWEIAVASQSTIMMHLY